MYPLYAAPDIPVCRIDFLKHSRPSSDGTQKGTRNMNQYLAWFDEIPDEALGGSAGGKGASLCRMFQNIPGGNTASFCFCFGMKTLHL